jgi:Tautomerase enzyme
MPVTRIAIRDGKTPQYKQALMDEIYEAMRETVAIKDGDRFMALTEHGENEFAYGSFLGIDRSADLVHATTERNDDGIIVAAGTTGAGIGRTVSRPRPTPRTTPLRGTAPAADAGPVRRDLDRAE